MANFLLKSETGLEGLQSQIDDLEIDQHEDRLFNGNQYENDESWRDLLPPGMEINKDKALPLDLNTLLRVLDHHNRDDEDPSYSTWQLVLIQCLLLLILVIFSVLWACCCRKRCFRAAPPTVQEALRKLSSSGSIKSRDFPPSYSQADLHTLAMSVQDYLYPPPQYPDVFNRSGDDLAYLDLEAGHNRLARLSFSSPAPSYASLQSDSPVIQRLPLSRQPSSFSTISSSTSSESRKSSTSLDSTGSRKNSIMKDPNSRKSSTSQDSRRSSRISFSEAVECSNGSYRRLSGKQDFSRVDSANDLLARRDSTQDILQRRASAQDILALKHSSASATSSPDLINLSRRGSSSSVSSGEGSRRGSLLLSRKLGLSQEALDKQLRKKLESIEAEERELQLKEEEEEARKAALEKNTIIQEDSSSPSSILETVVEIEKY